MLHNRLFKSALLLSSLGLLTNSAALAQAAKPAAITVQVNKPGGAVSRNMYGLFFEDINFAADGASTQSWSRTSPSKPTTT
jgi:alpha-N-arabinofuranosidase